MGLLVGDSFAVTSVKCKTVGMSRSVTSYCEALVGGTAAMFGARTQTSDLIPAEDKHGSAAERHRCRVCEPAISAYCEGKPVIGV